jgi:hypothetical protein
VRRIPALAYVAGALFAVLMPLASLGLWAQREVVSTSVFDHLADRVLEQRPVRRQLAQTVVAELDSEVPELAGQRQILGPVVARVVGAAQVRAALARSLAHTHLQLRNGHDPLQLDLNPVLPIVRQQLPGIVAAQIPADIKIDTVTVLHRRDAPAIWVSVEFVQGFALAVAVATVALLLIAIAASRRRGLVCLVLGAITTIVSLIMIALVEPGRTLVEHEAGGSIRREAVRAGYYTVVHPFATQMIVIAVAGVALALGGIILAREDRPLAKPTSQPPLEAAAPTA